MLDPKKTAELEQNIAFMSDHLPRIWASLYRNCLLANLSPQLAATFVQTYILATNSSHIFGISPEDGPKPEITD
jgi:hypothetical protein